MKFYSINE